MTRYLYKFILLSFFIFSTKGLYSQSQFSFSLSPGASYYPLSELNNSYNGSAIDGIHFKTKNQIYFTPLLTLEYSPVTNHNIVFGIEYLNLQPIVQVLYDKYIFTYTEIADVKYKITGFPMSLMYLYQLSDFKISPVIGLGISYINTDILVEKLYTSRDHVKTSMTTNFYSANIIAGMKTDFNKNLQLTSMFIYKHSSNFEYNNKKIDLSGLNFYLGITYNP